MCLTCGCNEPDNVHGDSRPIPRARLQAAAAEAGITIVQAAENILLTITGALDSSGPDPGLPVAKTADPAQQYVLGVAYQAGPDPRIQRGQDGGRDFFTEAELEKAAWQFLRSGPQVGLYHVDGTEGAATVVESYIYRGPEWDLGDGIVVKSGDWLVGAILDDQAWQLHKAGKINGWSPQGTARRLRRVTRE